MSDAVALTTDLHASLPAAEEALARMDGLGIRRVRCDGVDLDDCGCAYVSRRDRGLGQRERVGYDVDAVGGQVRAAGPPVAYAERLRAGG